MSKLPKLKKLVFAAILVMSVLPLIFAVSLYFSAYYYRWQAYRLLNCALKMKPGITTEEQFKAAVKPYEKYLAHGWESESGKPTITTDTYGLANYPASMSKYFDCVPSKVGEFTAKHLMLPATVFFFSPRFDHGKLANLNISEMQDGVDGIHPFLAEMTYYDRPEEDMDPQLADRHFTGYEVSSYEESYEDSSGKAYGASWIIRQYVKLDDRATADEQRRAFSFNLACFTSFRGCRDARKLLQPAPNR